MCAVYPSIYTHYYIKHFQLLSHVGANNGWIENKPGKNTFLAKYERFLSVEEIISKLLYQP